MDLLGAAARSAAMDVRGVAPSIIGALDSSATIDLVGRPIDSLLDVARPQLDALLPDYLRSQRWFAGKGATIESARIGDVVPIPAPDGGTRPVGHLAMIDVAYADGTAPERYATTLATFRAGSAASTAEGVTTVARVAAAEGEYVLADAITDAGVVDGLVQAMRGGRLVRGTGSTLVGAGGQSLENALRGVGESRVSALSLHTSNTSVRIDAEDGRAYALKLVRRHDALPEPGTPTRALDVWKGAYLTDEAGYRNTPAVLGSIEHLDSGSLPRTVSVLTEFVPNDGDGWAHALSEASGTLATARAGGDGAAVEASIGRYADAARNHGRRLGELHVALSNGPDGSEFRGVREGIGAVGVRSDQLRDEAARAIEQLRAKDHAADAARIEAAIGARIDEFERAAEDLVPIDEIHTHGDFHLGQLLRTGDDVQVIDLEGAPALPLAERWQRTVALGDVARQRSSYEYAASQALRDSGAADGLRPVADRWAREAQDAFLEGWLDATSDRRFRHARTELGPELQQAELANALYETSYELGSRPDWVSIPLARLERIVAGRA
jgi:trehalose synthase-fused probable maltokinase